MQNPPRLTTKINSRNFPDPNEELQTIKNEIAQLENNILIHVNDEDYNLPFDLFQLKVVKLEPIKQMECITEYCRRVSEKNEKLTSEHQRLTSEHRKLTEELKLRKTIQSLTEGAPTTIFRYIIGLDSVPDEIKACPLEVIVDSWRSCRHSDRMPDLAASLNVPESHVQAAFTVAIQVILSNLRYRCTLIEKTKVMGSESIPDLMIVPPGISHPGFHDLRTLIEVKSPTVQLYEAAAQAAKYFAENSQQRIKTNCSLRSFLAIGSNYNEICIFGFPNQDVPPILQHYKAAQCFPVGWKTQENPTDGFIDLCHAIHQTGNSTSRYIQINNLDVVITGTIHEIEEVGVYRCTYLNQELVIKQGYGTIGKSIVELELEKLKAVSKVVEFHPCLVPWREDLKVQHGFTIHLGTVISDPTFRNQDFLKKQYSRLIQGLRILHRNDLYHMDIRPGNIIVYENSARLIDWLTLQRSDVIHAWLRQGHDDPFWPVHRERFNLKSLFYLWDLISLGYTFLFLAVDDLSDRLELQIDRFKVVNTLLTDPTFVGDVARIIYYLETTTDDDNKNLLYETCLNMLQLSNQIE